MPVCTRRWSRCAGCWEEMTSSSGVVSVNRRFLASSASPVERSVPVELVWVSRRGRRIPAVLSAWPPLPPPPPHDDGPGVEEVGVSSTAAMDSRGAVDDTL